MYAVQAGTLRFCGSTEFSAGLWAGVELDKAEGKNDGSVAGVQYFTCRFRYGTSSHNPKLQQYSLNHTHVILSYVRLPLKINISVISLLRSLWLGFYSFLFTLK